MHANPTVHSADVRLHLNVAGQEFPLSHVEPDCVILRSELEMPPQVATIVVSVDGREHRRSVFLPDGIRAGNRKVKITELVSEAVSIN